MSPLHACDEVHTHTCDHCGRTEPCCKPECRHLPHASCVGNCSGLDRMLSKLPKQERSALRGAA